MKRLQIYVEERVDDELARESARRGISKAAIVREAIARELDGLPPADVQDRWGGLIGLFSDGGVDDIDEFLYGPIG